MHRVRKRFGQHFLHDQKVISRIADAIAPQAGDRLIEIGPGQGALTVELLKRIPSLAAIEIDRDLAAELTGRFGEDRLQLHVGDVLDMDFTALRGDGPKLRIVGNLPYNISTPLLFHLLEHRDAIQDMHFMLQKEVVDRMAAQSGSKAYGRLTVALAPWVKVESLFIVGPRAFKPPPKVDSAIARLTPWDPLPFTVDNTAHFDTVIRSAFSMRRKTLRNTLKGLIDEDTIAGLGIDPGLRPERLTPAQFAQLASAYGQTAPPATVPAALRDI